MSYSATGRLHKIFDTEEKSASFSVRDFVIETADDKFPQMVKFQLTQDRCALIDDYAEGANITVEFDLRGREWNDKYFTNLNAWRIGAADGQGGANAGGAGNASSNSAQGNAPAQNKTTDAAGSTPFVADDDFDDDIPF